MLCSASSSPLLIVWVFTEQNDSNKKNHSYRCEKTGELESYLKQQVAGVSVRQSRQRAYKSRVFARTACPKKWTLPRQPRNHGALPHPRPEPIHRSPTDFSDTPVPAKSQSSHQLSVKCPPKGQTADWGCLRHSRAGIHIVLPNLIEIVSVNEKCDSPWM